MPYVIFKPQSKTDTRTAEHSAETKQHTLTYAEQNEKENEKMKNECREYAEMIRNDINRLYDGETVDECESLWDYVADALDQVKEIEK